MTEHSWHNNKTQKRYAHHKADAIQYVNIENG